MASHSEGTACFEDLRTQKALRRIFEATSDEVTGAQTSYKIGVFKVFTFHPC
jgi:hypothetical protein